MKSLGWAPFIVKRENMYTETGRHIKGNRCEDTQEKTGIFKSKREV
jgi:hypothetical protein